jgi:3-hydroxyisobutyrate dehydrogenase-like beta-hydroxyacid dehydrogenase
MIQREVKVAVIGVGYMGSVVAELLARDGHDVIVWNRTREKAEAMLAKGVKRVVSTVSEAIREADHVWISLAVYSAIKEVLMTEDVRHVLANKQLLTQTATRPSQIEELQSFVTGAGGFLSEVTTVGLPFMMRDKSAIMVYAGQELERWKPILGVFSNEVLYQGGSVRRPM